MLRTLPYSPPIHGSTAKPAVLLVNLGTPEAPTAAAIRRYLKQFLWDPRVVEMPRMLPRFAWWLILNGFILNTRPARSAAKYARIWMAEGSPLRVHTERQAKLLRGALDSREPTKHVVVGWAMRYGEPALATILDRLHNGGCSRIQVLPLYPQFAGSTHTSLQDEVTAWIRRTQNPPELRFAQSYPAHQGYIAALAASVRQHWEKQGQPSTNYRLVMSFHGLPRHTLERGDPYYYECQDTAQQLAEALKLRPDEWLLTFQSRFGPGAWLQPYTLPTLEKLARAGVKRVDTICPGFAADCLETLEEIAIECKSAYLQAGGDEFHYIPCLNERDDWIAALAELATSHLGNWPTSGTSKP